MRLPLEHQIVIAAGISGVAELHWGFAALFGGAAFLLTKLDEEKRAALQRSGWSAIVGAALIGAGQCCLSWAVGCCARVMAGL
jgi:hypothetical protein